VEWNRSAQNTDTQSCEVGNEHLHISWNVGNFTSWANKYQIVQKVSIPMETVGNVVNSRGAQLGGTGDEWYGRTGRQNPRGGKMSNLN